MREARARDIPFWPAASILDMPSIIRFWEDCAAEAEARARPALERRAAERANATNANR